MGKSTRLYIPPPKEDDMKIYAVVRSRSVRYGTSNPRKEFLSYWTTEEKAQAARRRARVSEYYDYNVVEIEVEE